MGTKNDIKVVINDKMYTLSGFESDGYLQQVAHYMNGKIDEFKRAGGYDALNPEYQSLMLSLNIADDYFKAKEQADKLENEVSDLEKKVFDLQREAIELKINYETATKLAQEYKQKLAKSQGVSNEKKA